VILLAKTTFSFCGLFDPFLSPFGPILRVPGTFLTKHAQHNEKNFIIIIKILLKYYKTSLNIDQGLQIFAKLSQNNS
jgi:hypothetical protein